MRNWLTMCRIVKVADLLGAADEYGLGSFRVGGNDWDNPDIYLDGVDGDGIVPDERFFRPLEVEPTPELPEPKLLSFGRRIL